MDRTPTRRRRFKPTLITLLIGVIVLLALANGIAIAAKPLFLPGPPVPGALLYATDFADPATPDWEQYRSALTAQIADGRLQLSADSVKDNIFAPLAYPFGDFDLRVVAKQTAGADPYSEYGVIFRYQDKNNYYILRVRSDGAYRVTRAKDGKQEDLSAATDPERVGAPFTIGLNWPNDLRIVAQGGRFRFYINGKLLTLCPKGNDRRSTWNGDQCASNNKQTATELTDDSFRGGQIALSIYENIEAVAVEFDHLVIYAP